LLDGIQIDAVVNLHVRITFQQAEIIKKKIINNDLKKKSKEKLKRSKRAKRQS
jgi:hypothetical protein